MQDLPKWQAEKAGTKLVPCQKPRNLPYFYLFKIYERRNYKNTRTNRGPLYFSIHPTMGFSCQGPSVSRYIDLVHLTLGGHK